MASITTYIAPPWTHKKDNNRKIKIRPLSVWKPESIHGRLLYTSSDKDLFFSLSLLLFCMRRDNKSMRRREKNREKWGGGRDICCCCCCCERGEVEIEWFLTFGFIFLLSVTSAGDVAAPRHVSRPATIIAESSTRFDRSAPVKPSLLASALARLKTLTSSHHRKKFVSTKAAHTRRNALSLVYTHVIRWNEYLNPFLETFRCLKDSTMFWSSCQASWGNEIRILICLLNPSI